MSLRSMPLVVLGLTACASTADLRPPELVASPPSTTDETRGREVLNAMVDAHGGIERWKAFNFVHAKVSDAWFSKMIFALVVPFADNPEYVILSAYTQRLPDGRLEFPGGENAGHTWVIRGDEFITKAPGEAPVTERLADDAIRSLLSMNFLFLPGMPFYLHTADRVSSLGRETIDGRVYDKIFLSWGDYAPQTNIDQWVVWVDAETHLLSYVHLTARQAGMSQQFVLRAYDYVDAQGLQVASKYDGIPEFGDDPLHTYAYEDVEFSQRKHVDLLDGAP